MDYLSHSLLESPKALAICGAVMRLFLRISPGMTSRGRLSVQGCVRVGEAAALVRNQRCWWAARTGSSDETSPGSERGPMKGLPWARTRRNAEGCWSAELGDQCWRMKEWQLLQATPPAVNTGAKRSLVPQGKIAQSLAELDVRRFRAVFEKQRVLGLV